MSGCFWGYYTAIVGTISLLRNATALRRGGKSDDNTPLRRTAELGGSQVGLSAPELEFIAGDASPRQYYRVRCHTGQLGVSSCIVMVSPPSENNEAFLHVGRRLAAAGIQTPTVLAQAEAQGWFLLEDFGDVQLLSVLNAENRLISLSTGFSGVGETGAVANRRCGHTAL